MDDDQRLAPSRSLSLSIADTGALLARASVSAPSVYLDLDVLSVLTAFAGTASPDRAFLDLSRTWQIERAEFDEAVSGMIASGLLVPASGVQDHTTTDGFGSVLMHHFMLRDTERVETYRRAITRYAPGKRVLEIGCGTGILSLFAARARALSVDAIEETAIAEVARDILRTNGGGSVRLHRGNSRNINLGTRAEVVIHELIGSDPFDENMLATLEDAKSRLAVPEARFLPERFEIGCVGVDLHGVGDAQRREVLDEITTYGRRYHVDLSVMRQLISRLPATTFRRNAELAGRPPIVTTECRLMDVDFGKESLSSPQVYEPLSVTSLSDASIGALWVYFRAVFDDEIALSTAPGAPATHWQPDLRVLESPITLKRGERLTLTADLRLVAGRQRLVVGPLF